MSLYSPRELEKSLEERYEGYGRRCRSEGINPLPFRSWAIIDAEFDVEWTAAKLEYGEALVELLILEVLLDIRELLRERLDPPPL